MPRGRVMANTWHGSFPWRNDLPKKHGMTTPVGSYPANGYGLVDVSGNVWEWTASPWTASHADVDVQAEPAPSCCAPASAPRAPGSSPKVDHTSVRRTIATVIVPPPGKGRRFAARPGIWGSAAWPIREPKSPHLTSPAPSDPPALPQPDGVDMQQNPPTG